MSNNKTLDERLRLLMDECITICEKELLTDNAAQRVDFALRCLSIPVMSTMSEERRPERNTNWPNEL